MPRIAPTLLSVDTKFNHHAHPFSTSIPRGVSRADNDANSSSKPSRKPSFKCCFAPRGIASLRWFSTRRFLEPTSPPTTAGESTNLLCCKRFTRGNLYRFTRGYPSHPELERSAPSGSGPSFRRHILQCKRFAFDEFRRIEQWHAANRPC